VTSCEAAKVSFGFWTVKPGFEEFDLFGFSRLCYIEKIEATLVNYGRHRRDGVAGIKGMSQ
jgi:hypothetical protein